jgi:GntR family transcriptional regulator
MTTDDLHISRIDPASPIPLYYQVEHDLRRLINEGELMPGMSLPAEMDLSSKYGVSRQTIRQALARLAADDLISRGAGRGTFVKPKPDRTRFYLDRSFTQQMAEMGRQAHSIILEQDAGTIDHRDPKALQGASGSACFRLSRLRFGDDEPIGIQHVTILTERCPGLDRHNFAAHSLYEILSREYNLMISAIRHTITAEAADIEQARLLQIETGTPLLVVNTTCFLDTSQVIEHTSSYYRADRYEYSTLLNNE